MRQHNYFSGLIIALVCLANTSPALAQVCVGKPLTARQTLFAVRAMNPAEGRMIGALAAQRLTIPLPVSASYHRIDREESQSVDLAGFESSLEGTLTDGGSRVLAVCPVAGVG